MSFKFLKDNFLLMSIAIAICLICTIFMGANYLKDQLFVVEQNKYSIIAANMRNRTANLISDKHSSTTAIALSLSNNSDLINIFQNQRQYNAVNNLSKVLADSTDYKNVWIQLINTEGQSIYRSWDNSKGDSLSTIRGDVQKVLTTKQMVKSISVGKYTISFKSMTPIFDGEKFVGIIEVITHFNSLSNKLAIDNIDSLFIADKKFKNQLKKAVTKRFIDGYYIANLEPSTSMLEFLENNNIDKLIAIDDFKILDDNIVTSYRIKDESNNVIGYALLKYRLSAVNNQDINTFAVLIKFFTFVLLAFVVGVIYLFKLYKDSKETEEDLENMQKYEAILKQKVIEKTHELADLNATLEERIRIELEKNKNQDIMLQQQSKLAAIGEMIDAVAHQWKQPINIIKMRVDTLGYDFTDKLVNQEYITDFQTKIFHQIKHMTDTLDGFRSFFRPNKELKEFDMKIAVDKVLLLIKDEFIKHQINIDVNVIQNFQLLGMENEFKHLILNILNNAKDAFYDNNIENRNITINILLDDKSKKIEICDNAGGIPSEIIEHIFKANVTTKEQGKGTGIGLYMSSQIAVKHHGTLSAINIENGAKFIFEQLL